MIDDAIDLADLPASRTMPYHQPLGVQNLNSSYYTLQNDTYGMPQNCEILAIANGSKLGGVGGQNFNSGDLIFQLKENTYSIINSLLGWDNFWSSTVAALGNLVLWRLGTNVKTDIRIWALPHNPYSYEKIYKGKIKTKVLGFWLVKENRTVEITNCMGIDAAPGGLIFPHTASVIPGPIAPDVYELGGFCFTPTTSTLNYHSVTGTNHYGAFDVPYHNYSNNTQEITANMAKNINNYVGNTQSETYYTEHPPVTYIGSFKNTKHTFFTQESANFMLYHLTGKNGDLNDTIITTRHYNYGIGNITGIHNYNSTTIKRTKSKITKLQTIQHGGKVMINKNGKIGYMDLSGNPNSLGNSASPSHFAVWLMPACDSEEPRWLRVRDGGELIIGQTDWQTGELHIMPNTKLIIQDGGTLTLNADSKLIIHSGGELIIQDGGVITNHGKIIIKEFYGLGQPGALKFDDGAKIYMSRDYSELHFDGGDLFIGEDAVFTFNTHSSSQSGQVRFSGVGPHIYGTNNSRFSLLGNSNQDIVLVLDKNAEFWSNTLTELTRINISNGKVLLDSNAFLISPQQFYLTNSTISNISQDPPRGIITFDYARFFNCEINNTPILSHAFFPNGKLNITNSAVNYNLGNQAVRALNRGLQISNSNFTVSDGTAIYSNNLDYPSYINNSDFTGNLLSLFVVDESSGLVKLNGNTFDTGQIGTLKNLGGEFAYRCNSFNNIYAPIYAANLSIVNLSNFSNNLGYNTFSNAYISSIVFENAGIPILGKGYNNFHSNSSSSPYFTGDINFAGFTTLNAPNNEWNSSLTNPSPSSFAVSNNGAQVTIVTNPTQSATCGQYDVNTNTTPYISSEPLNAVIALPIGGGFVTGPADQLLGDAMEMSKVIDTANGNNSAAIDMFHSLMLFDYSTTNASASTIQSFLDYTLRQMKYTLQSAFEHNEVSEEDNLVSFDPLVQKYVDGLNKKSTYIQVQNNKAGLLAHELDKVMLFDLIGHKTTSLALLYNTQYCGLDSIDQFIVNKYIYNIESSKLHQQLGYESYLNDSIVVATSGYLTPNSEGPQQYAFGSVINSLNSITYENDCSPQTNKQSFFTTNDITVFPSPTNQYLTFKYNVGLKDNAKVTVYNLDGKQVAYKSLASDLNQETITIENLSSGLYIYKYEVNGVTAKTGKITKL